jgi:hypothetical protein
MPHANVSRKPPVTARSKPDDSAIGQAMELGEINRGIKDIIHSLAGEAQTRSALTARALAKPEIPAPLKWAGGIIAGLFTAGTATLAFWLVSSVSEMQVTLGRMDERMASGVVRDSRVDALELRVAALEAVRETEE